MKRTDLMDTKEWAHQEIVRRLRLMTPAERAKMVVQMSMLALDKPHNALDVREIRGR